MNPLSSLKARLIEYYGCHEDDFQGTTDLTDDLGLDSLDKTDLMMWCEKEFKVSINSYESENIQTLDQLCKYIENRSTGVRNKSKDWKDVIKGWLG